MTEHHNRDDLLQDTTKKLATVLTFEFEARVRLSQWTELNTLVEMADKYHLSALSLSGMADIILRSDAPDNAVFSVVESLANASLHTGKCDVPQLSRWMRLLFTIALNRDQIILTSLGSKLLALLGTHASSYPQDEIQWLAVMTFNRAVDLHGASDRQGCHRMCEIALGIGNYAVDEGLKFQIQQNYRQMVDSM